MKTDVSPAVDIPINANQGTQPCHSKTIWNLESTYHLFETLLMLLEVNRRQEFRF